MSLSAEDMDFNRVERKLVSFKNQKNINREDSL